MRKTSLALVLLAMSGGTAFAATPVGHWRVQDDNAEIRITYCGHGALCGYAKSGPPILDHMRRTGRNSWTGIINDSRSGSRYDGTISLVTKDQLRVHGCMQGGGMCGDQMWTRAR